MHLCVCLVAHAHEQADRHTRAASRQKLHPKAAKPALNGLRSAGDDKRP